MKMIKYLLIALLIIAAGVILFFCLRPGPDDTVTDPAETTEDEEDKVNRCDLCQLRYEKESPGGKFSIFIDQYYEKVTIHVTETDGGQRLYHVSNRVMFELYDYIKSEDMLNWRFLDSKDVEPAGGTKIKVTCRIISNDKTFGTERMPAGGLKKLEKITEIISAHEDPEKEIEPFTVTIKGKTYNTVRGTGNITGTGAVIDFGDDKWWQVEEFTGHYELTENARETYAKEYPQQKLIHSKATLDIYEDGRFVLQVDDDEAVETQVAEKRLYGCYPSVAGNNIIFDFIFDEELNDDGNILYVNMDGMPCPETFRGYNLCVEKIEK